MGSRNGESRRPDASLPPGNPIEGLLEEMHDLRMTLAADLSVAAGAADAGAEDVARDIIEADRAELARFARVANIRLEGLDRPRPQAPAARPAWRRRIAVALPVVPVVGAMALSAAAATGVLPVPGATHRANPPAVRADDRSPATTYQQLVDVLDGDPSASQVIAAASKLHRQLRNLIAASPNDPDKTAEIAQLLRMEQSLLLRTQPPGASVVLNATRKLAARLVTVVPDPTITPTLVPTAQPHSHKPEHHAVPSPSASPDAEAPSAKPATNPTKKPDPSPSPSSTPFTIPE
jgi:hypothetical protein